MRSTTKSIRSRRDGSNASPTTATSRAASCSGEAFALCSPPTSQGPASDMPCSVSDSKRVTADTKTDRAIERTSKAQRARHSEKRLREEAFRVRAGAIGLLQCCTCTYPLEQHATATFHDERCPAHEISLSAMRAGRHHHLNFVPSSKEPPT